MLILTSLATFFSKNPLAKYLANINIYHGTGPMKDNLKPIPYARSSTQSKTLRSEQKGRHFAEDIFKCIFMNQNVCHMSSVFKISAGPRTLTGKIWVGPASFPSLSYINIYKFWQNCASVWQVSDLILKTVSLFELQFKFHQTPTCWDWFQRIQFG